MCMQTDISKLHWQLFHGTRQGEVCFRDIGKVGLWNSNEITSQVGIIKLQSLSATNAYGSVDANEKKKCFQAETFFPQK